MYYLIKDQVTPQHDIRIRILHPGDIIFALLMFPPKLHF